MRRRLLTAALVAGLLLIGAPRERAAAAARDRGSGDDRRRAGPARGGLRPAARGVLPGVRPQGQSAARPDARAELRPQLDRRAADRRRPVQPAEHHVRAQAAPLADQLDFTGDKTHAVEDIVVGDEDPAAVGERRAARRSACGSRRKLPNASNESGLGLDTTDFYVAGAASARPSSRSASSATSVSASSATRRAAITRTTC